MRSQFRYPLITAALISINSLLAVNDSAVLEDKFLDSLSEYEFFVDLKTQTPSEGVIPYDLISSLFSDYSFKKRFIYVPKGKKATLEKDWVFDFPVGSALIKTFYYQNDQTNLQKGINLLETRLLLRKENKWVAASYVWNQDKSDAFLKIAGKAIKTSWIDKEGVKRHVRYKVPNTNQCKECHQTGDEISPIGPKARNLNKDFNYGEKKQNQLAKWFESGIISELPTNVVSNANWKDKQFSLEERARSYLAINCGHCHMPSGSANSTGLYLDFMETKQKSLGIFKKPVASGRGSGGLKYSIVPGYAEESILLYRMLSIDPGVMMPEAGRSLVHKEAVLLIEEWINSMRKDGR